MGNQKKGNYYLKNRLKKIRLIVARFSIIRKIKKKDSSNKKFRTISLLASYVDI